MSIEDARRVTKAAIDAATRAMGNQQLVVVVVVREIGGTGVNVGSNVVGGRENMLRVLKEGEDALKGDA